MEFLEAIDDCDGISGKAKRGLIQGDLMSPYLFVLSMEYLGRELQQLTKNGNFNFHPRSRKLESLLNEAFMKFSRASGLHANTDKSSLYIDGVNDHTKHKLLEELSYNKGTIPFRYLGVPLVLEKLSVNQFMPLIEKITAKVTCWSAKLLSYAGKV
ncbi:hypothetical protein KY284_008094 [Solanum tuberosum]|nr:hypothetical protein KY284_008094 [Solanum tuberosum]